MIEKVNPSHPDKLADRIAGAIVDLAYIKEPDPKIAVEVLIGHRQCHVVIETSSPLEPYEISKIVHRIGGNVQTDIRLVPQDTHLAANQRVGLRCGDNGIFKGMPLTREQKQLSDIAHQIYAKYPADGKYILDGDRLIICQSNASSAELRREHPGAEINPLGTGRAARIQTPARPTVSWGQIWRIPLRAAEFTGRISPRRMSRQISTHF